MMPEKLGIDGVEWNFPELEEQIRSAKNYVVPSDNLRPRAMLLARECWSDKMSNRKFYRIVVCVTLIMAMMIYTVQGITLLSSSIVPMSSDDIEYQALQSADQQNISVDWALQEEYSRYRSLQANHIESTLFDPLSSDISK